MKFEPIPKYGDLMTLDNFIECCQTGGFIDYDGHGYYAMKDKMSDKLILPSHITGRRDDFDFDTGKFKKIEVPINIDRSFTHVVWFNK